MPATGPIEIAAGCAGYVDIEPPPPHDRGVSITVELEGDDADVELARMRLDRQMLESPTFRRDRSGSRLVFASGVQATGHASRFRVVVNNPTTRPLALRSLRVTSDHDVPPHPVGAILSAEHYTEVAVSRGRRSAEVWLPLPVLHGSQVPLDVQVRLDPPDAGKLEFVRHGATNWGLLARFPPSFAHERVVIAWTATVMVRDVLPSDRPRIYPNRAGDDQWLQATPTADARDPRAQAIAQTLIAEAGDDPSRRVQALLSWISSLDPPPERVEPFVPGADDGGNTSSASLIAPTTGMGCTSTTNVASALGRALGVPTRHVAGIVTGEALQTHSVNEFLIGSPRSWVRVEPQNGETVAQDYMVVLRLVPVIDEGPASIDRARWGAPGVPMYALVEALDDRARLVLEDVPDHFPGCPRCDNAASRLATLQDTSMDRIERLDARARALWEREQAQWIGGTKSPGVARIRAHAATVTSLDDLERLLDDIDST